jgi:hypothetical protein
MVKATPFSHWVETKPSEPFVCETCDKEVPFRVHVVWLHETSGPYWFCRSCATKKFV